MKQKLLTILITFSITLCVLGHSGRTDKNGGHYNRKTGEYHYHGKKGFGNGILWVLLIGGVIYFFILKSPNEK